MNRAYSLIEIKSFDEDERVIEGVATTPEADRVGDIVEPMGAKYQLPIPLLWQHNSEEPIGEVFFAKPTPKGIPFKAKLAKIDEPGNLKDRLDEAWQSIKIGLVRAVSIGFRQLSYEIMKDGGYRFKEWEWLELSAVTIPAQSQATIQVVKSLSNEQLAATGRKLPEEPTPPAPGKKPNPIVKAQEAKSMTKQTYAEQISAYEATRAAKSAEMDTIMQAAGEKGETLDTETKEKHDNLEVEVKAIDEHLVRLRSAEARQIATAKPVNGKSTEDAGNSRGDAPVISVKRNVEKGIIFTRVLGAKYLAYKHGVSPIEVAKSRFADTPEVEMILRAPIAAMNTTDASSAGPLVTLQNATGEFIELLRSKTIIDRLGLRRVPFNIKVPRGTSDPTAYWIGQGKVKPVSSMAFDNVELTFAKVAGIVPMTEELMRFSNPAAEGLVRDGLVAAVTYLIDHDFLDPTKAADNVSPASVTNGVTPITASGTNADALRADLGSLLDEYEDDNMGADGLVLVMTPKLAGRISLMRNTLGQREFEGLGRDGGSLEGIRVITSSNIVATGGSPVDGGLIVALNANSIFLADDGGVEIDISREASLQMESSPDSPTTGATNLVSLWQHNMVAIRAERFINWKKARTGAVQFIQNAKYA